MNSAELAANVLSQLESTETAFIPPDLNEKAKQNAGRMMQEIIGLRLRAGGSPRLAEQILFVADPIEFHQPYRRRTSDATIC